MRWTIRKVAKTYPFDSAMASIIGPATDPIEVVSASFTDSDVERVAEALYERHKRSPWADHYTDEELRALARGYARAALSAYLEPTTKKET